jgi:hypothetical protein
MHPVHGWDPVLKDEIFQQHSCHPTGHNTIAKQAVFAEHWLLNLASPEVCKHINQDLVNYKVHFVLCFIVSVLLLIDLH